MKKHLAAAVSAFAFLSLPVCGQAAAVPDPAAVQATRQMMEAMKVRELMVQSMRQAEQGMPAQMRATLTAVIRNNRDLSEPQKQAALAEVESRLPAMMASIHAVMSDPSLVDEMLAEMAPLYAETYTVDELRQLAAFYASPLGQKMLASTPKLMVRGMEIGNRLMLPRIQKLMEQAANSVAGK